MKNYIKTFIAMGLLLFLCASCEDAAPLTTLQTVRFSAPVETTASDIVLTPATQYQSVVTISWHDALFPVDAPVSYALQFDIPGDTVGADAWKNATRIEAGEEVFSKSFIGDELNDMAIALGLPRDVANPIVVRVVASLDRVVYSDPITLTITPFTEQVAFGEIYMPGGYNAWNFATAAALPAISAGVYQGYVTFPPSGTKEFKFTIERNWNQFYGADGNGNFAQNGNNNLTVPAFGSYQVTVNLNTMTYSAVPFSWGVIGTATAGGWNTDTDMSYDHINHYWVYSGPLLSGALKFRLNDAWTINYGPNTNADTVVFLDNPGAYTIGAAGNYRVTFAVNPDPATANYTVTPL